MHTLVAEIALDQPDAIAVRYRDDQLTYATLIADADAVARALIAVGVRTGDRVAVIAGPSIAAITGLLGVMRAGAAYVPIDPAQPDAHIAAVATAARASAILVADEDAHRIRPVAVPVLLLSTAVSAGGPRLTPTAVTATNAAYLIYTSGSTGNPKGVVVRHGELAASTAARRAVYPGSAVFLLLSPLAFDSSVAGLWGTLTSGGCLVVAEEGALRDPDALLDLVATHAVTRMLCIPALYSALLDATARDLSPRSASLRTVILAGEPLPQSVADRHFAQPNPPELVNEYGPTEATVWASYQRLRADQPVTIGKPVPGARLYVLDEQRRPISEGEQGELYIGGACVAEGYFEDPETTAKAFLPDPFVPEATARMYRTGDLVRWNGEGALEFLGRTDDQVKVRGQRLALSAVEAHFSALPGIREAAVVFHRTHGELHAFVVAETPLTDVAIRRGLSERVPAAMVPSRIELRTALPRNANGKLDRIRLREQAESRGGTEPSAPPAAGGTYAALPETLADKVSAAWAEVLAIPAVPAETNFYDLGGHSLALFRLRDAISRHVGAELSMVDLFQYTTVSAQAAFLRESLDADANASDAPRDLRRGRAARIRQQRISQGACT